MTDSRPPTVHPELVRASHARFLSVNAVGGLVNYGVYAVLVAFAAAPFTNPFLALGVGSLAGLAFNFFGSKFFVFHGKA